MPERDLEYTQDAVDLGTAVYRLDYDFVERRGRLYMPPLCNCDMGACVALFERIDPAVVYIETFAGDEPDTTYRKQWNEWL